MPHEGATHTETQTQSELDQIEDAKQTDKEARRSCIARGGKWDAVNKICDLDLKVVPKEPPSKPPKVTPEGPEVFTNESGRASGITLPDGRTFFGLSPDEVAQIAGQQADIQKRPLGTEPVGSAQRRADIQFKGEQLSGQVGQFGQLGVSPTGLDVGEAAVAGVVGAIPRALGLAATGAALGAAGGTVVAPGIGTAAGAAIGAAAGFVSGLASSMIGNFKSQRTDTTTAQQRILDEGKQTLQDWVTLAKNDPANRVFYLAQYNQQSAQIDQAFRQMKLDTSKDVAKFETALPNLAEFNSFYSVGGERDALNNEMQIALTGPLPEGYDLFELAERRK